MKMNSELICQLQIRRVENGYLLACMLPGKLQEQVLYAADIGRLGDLLTTFLIEEKLNANN
jgi:hypothetical protein